MHANTVASSQALYQIRNKKGESLEDFDHVLDMVGCGLQDHTCPSYLVKGRGEPGSRLPILPVECSAVP